MPCVLRCRQQACSGFRAVNQTAPVCAAVGLELVRPCWFRVGAAVLMATIAVPNMEYSHDFLTLSRKVRPLGAMEMSTAGWLDGKLPVPLCAALHALKGIDLFSPVTCSTAHFASVQCCHREVV